MSASPITKAISSVTVPPRISPFAEPARCELDRVAGLAMTLADNGHLLLAQGRVAEDRVAYFAIMATRRTVKGGRQ